MPESIIEKFKKNIPPQFKICFWSAIIIGLIAHLYKITNWLPNWDSLVFRYDAQNMVSMGRWFLPIASAPSSFYDLPFLTGLMAILFYGVASVFICKMFSVKKKTTAVLIAGAVVSFPTVTSVMLYNYVADSYSLAFLLACIAAYLMTKSKPRNIIAAAVLITLSVGIYQAYITVTIMLLLCYLILEALRGEKDVKQILIKAVKFLLTGIVGMALYYSALVIILKITGTALLEYQGINTASSLTGLDILGSLYNIKESFVNYFFDFSKGVNLFNILNIVMFVSTFVFYLTDIIKRKLAISKVLVICLCTLLLPFGASILAFVNSGLDYHNLMKMGFFIFYLLFIIQYEDDEFQKQKLAIFKSWFVFALTVIIIFNQIVIANISYHKITIAYEKSYGTLIRIVDRIEQTEGAEDCDSILVLGALQNSEAYSSNLPPDMTGTTDGLILRADDEIVGQSVICSALNDYCDKDYNFISGERKTQLLEKIDAQNLGNWPEKNSICIIDNVIILKLGN